MAPSPPETIPVEIPIRIITHNVRYATKSPFPEEKPWKDRAPILINELRFHTLHCPESFICLQEALHGQLQDIVNGLNSERASYTPEAEAQKPKEWAFIGVGREDGEQDGEYSPILYRQSVYKLRYFRNLWLSETPDTPSWGWDAACKRILTAGIFEHRSTHKSIMAMNTHMDHVGKIARLESAKLIVGEVEKVHKIASRILNKPMAWVKREVAVFLSGDFNSESSQEAYRVLNSADSPIRDLRDLVPECRRYGHKKTYTGFGPDERQTRIDFLFVGKGQRWDPRMYAVVESRFDDRVFCSDHRAVVGDLVLLPDPEKAERVQPKPEQAPAVLEV